MHSRRLADWRILLGSKALGEVQLPCPPPLFPDVSFGWLTDHAGPYHRALVAQHQSQHDQWEIGDRSALRERVVGLEVEANEMATARP